MDSLKFCQQSKDLEIYAYVIIPSHVHLVAGREGGLMSDFIRDFKSHTARKVIEYISCDGGESRKEWLLHMFRYYAKCQKQNKEYQVWQKTSHPIKLFSNEVIDQKIDYIHMNPVKSGIVESPEHYCFSSAYDHRQVKVISA
ncbi:transposase [Marinoscillum sp. MHG1-6]|uniref:transposase n=1 Tax=Marinoscillum sp. MHG1-6 TaxID=2959627 RepID=UPI0021570F19